MRYEDILFSAHPSSHWAECYPLGNGNIGVMDYGNPKNDIVSLNDDRLWSGYGANKNNADKENREDVRDKIRNALDANNFSEAEKLVRAKLLGGWTESYLPLGNININSDITEYNDYRRELDMARGVHTVTYTTEKGKYTEESFVSEPAKCYIRRVTCPAPARYSFNIECPLRHTLCSRLTAYGGMIQLSGIAPSVDEPIYHSSKTPTRYDTEHPGREFAAKLAICTDGEVTATDGGITVSNCSYYEIILVTEVKYKTTKDLDLACDKKLAAAISKTYSKLLEKHIEDHYSLYNRCYLEIGDETTELSTEELLKANKKKKNNRLMTLLFNFGRYLTIASSREGTNAATLQGIWNDQVQPPWSSNYTININTEMNYWPTLPVGLAECHKPMLDLIKKVYKNGKKTAAEVFGLPGWCAGHNTDIWGQSSPVGFESDSNNCHYALFIGSAGWLCRHIYEHYLYTEDVSILSDNFQIMLDAARFYLGYLSRDNDTGKLICSPSASPENSFLKKGMHSLNKASTMDMTIIRELFENVLRCADILGYEYTDGLLDEIKDALKDLYPTPVNKAGRIQEWYGDYREIDAHHRHISHLYGAFPSDLWTYTKEPKLMHAVAKSMKRRGIKGTGWSIAWKANVFARLKDAKNAYKALNAQLTYVDAGKSLSMSGGGTYPSMLCAHPPFQIDGNFGATAAICEMLMQSHDGCIELLPALPKEWKKGKVRGLVARGGFTVDMEWFNNRLVSYKITHPTQSSVNVKIGDVITTVSPSRN